jgi:hypothetical protein
VGGTIMIYFYVFNYSKVLEDVEAENHINSLFEYLRANGVEVEIRIEMVKGSLKEEIAEYAKNESVPFIDNPDLILAINKFEKKTKMTSGVRDYRHVFIGENLKAQDQNEWGESDGYFAVIKNVHKKNIWHEVAHLLGAEDHYGTGRNLCKSSDICIMTYGNTEGELCEAALAEIRSYINALED